jgi:hypothetical protein
MNSVPGVAKVATSEGGKINADRHSPLSGPSAASDEAPTSHPSQLGIHNPTDASAAEAQPAIPVGNGIPSLFSPAILLIARNHVREKGPSRTEY